MDPLLTIISGSLEKWDSGNMKEEFRYTFYNKHILPLSFLSVEKVVISPVYLICYPTGQLKHEGSLLDWKWERQSPDSFPAYRLWLIGQRPQNRLETRAGISTWDFRDLILSLFLRVPIPLPTQRCTLYG